MKLKIHVGNYEIHILHAFREKMLVSNYSYIQVMACDTKMSYWLLRGFCFFLSLDRSCLVFPLLKLFPHIELLTLPLVRNVIIILS